MLERLKFYSVAEAKTELSRLIAELEEYDAIVTKNGIPAAAILKYDRYVKIIDFLEQVRDLYTMDVGSDNPGDSIEDMIENE